MCDVTSARRLGEVIQRRRHFHPKGELAERLRARSDLVPAIRLEPLPLTGPKISSAHIWANVYAGRNLSQTACCAVNVRLTLLWSGQAPSAPGLRSMGKFDAGAGKLSTSVTRAKPIQLIDGDRRMKHSHKLRQRLIKQALIFSPSRKPGAILRREEPHGLKTGIRHGARRKPGLPSILRQPVEVN
jgi:hypothetical protein